jgi:hypothetical protein
MMLGVLIVVMITAMAIVSFIEVMAAIHWDENQ